jgi:hypothetical protein
VAEAPWERLRDIAGLVDNSITGYDADRFLRGIYADGCDIHGSCFTCPLAACRYEITPGRARAELRATRLLEALRDGLTMDEAAAALGVSLRQAYRLRARLRERAAV